MTSSVTFLFVEPSVSCVGSPVLSVAFSELKSEAELSFNAFSCSFCSVIELPVLSWTFSFFRKIPRLDFFSGSVVAVSTAIFSAAVFAEYFGAFPLCGSFPSCVFVSLCVSISTLSSTASELSAPASSFSASAFLAIFRSPSFMIIKNTISAAPSHTSTQPEKISRVMIFGNLPNSITIPSAIKTRLPIRSTLHAPCPPFFRRKAPLNFHRLSTSTNALSIHGSSLITMEGVIKRNTPSTKTTTPLKRSMIVAVAFPRM